MTRMADTTDIMGKNRLIGRLMGNANAAESARQDADDDAFRAKSDVRRERRATNVAKAERDTAKAENLKLTQTLATWKDAAAEKDQLILEWMHSNEAFKLLARQYGKKLGVTDAQRTEEYQQNILDVAEEDPKYANTKIGKNIKATLEKKTAKP